MKLAIKALVAGAVMSAIATVAQADVLSPSSGNGELVLLVRDLSDTSRTFAWDLGITVDDVITQDTIANTPGTQAQLQNRQPIAYSYALPTLSNTGLTSFLGVSSALGYEYAVYGGDSTGANTFSPDARRLVGTTELQYGASALSSVTNGHLSNTGTSIFASGGEQFVLDLNEELAGNETTQTSNFGQTGTTGAGALNLWGLGNVTDTTAAVGTALNLYIWTSGGGTGSAFARVYQALDIKLTSDGTLAAVSAVPVPAAIWLLGSALAGMGAMSRRRKLIAA